MTPSVAAAHAPPSTKAHKPPTMARPVIPVIPLHYLKKKPKAPPAVTIATPPQEVLSRQASAERVTDPVILTPAPSPPLTTFEATAAQDGMLSEGSEAKNEGMATSQVRDSNTTTSHVRESDGSDEMLVEVKEAVEFCIDHIKCRASIYS